MEMSLFRLLKGTVSFFWWSYFKHEAALLHVIKSPFIEPLHCCSPSVWSLRHVCGHMYKAHPRTDYPYTCSWWYVGVIKMPSFALVENQLCALRKRLSVHCDFLLLLPLLCRLTSSPPLQLEQLCNHWWIKCCRVLYYQLDTSADSTQQMKPLGTFYYSCRDIKKQRFSFYGCKMLQKL